MSSIREGIDSNVGKTSDEMMLQMMNMMQQVMKKNEELTETVNDLSLGKKRGPRSTSSKSKRDEQYHDLQFLPFDENDEKIRVVSPNSDGITGTVFYVPHQHLKDLANEMNKVKSRKELKISDYVMSEDITQFIGDEWLAAEIPVA